tara:strand:+ start:10463 stop:11719 length:1257 start_codon:yes stop_codon:yes gene_type:complete
MSEETDRTVFTFEIASPDDQEMNLTTTLKCKDFQDIQLNRGRRYWQYWHNQRTIPVKPKRTNKKDSSDTYIQQISLALRRTINIREVIKKTERNSIYMRVGKANYLVAFRKDGIRYVCNGMNANFDILITAVAKVIYRSCYIDDEEALDDYFVKCVELPENIQYVLENRTPYFFFENGEQQDVRINVNQIDKELFALEISSGVWGEISLRDLNTFVNTFLKGHRKGKWHRISPKDLWTKLLGKKPSFSKEKVMVEFLKQNRTQDIVDRRAMELFDSLEIKFPKIKKVKWTRKGATNKSKMIVDALVVRGNLADWLLVDNAMKHEFQEVSTYVLVDGEGNYGSEVKCEYPTRGSKKLFWNGPICIDNMQGGASKGDQFATRALACMNDTILKDRVGTVTHYIRSIKEGQTKIRLDWDEL